VLARDRAACRSCTDAGRRHRTTTWTRGRTTSRPSSTRRSRWPRAGARRPGGARTRHRAGPSPRAQAATLRREAEEVEAGAGGGCAAARGAPGGIERCGELALVARARSTRSIGRSLPPRAARRAPGGGRRPACRPGRTPRGGRRECPEELDELRERRHAADLRRADVEPARGLTQRLRTELSLAPEDVRAEHPDAASYDPDALTRARGRPRPQGRPARPREPAGAGGVQGARGAPRVPVGPARRPAPFARTSRRSS
jgi:hypothetical protein